METLPSLRKMIVGFLRQRLAAADRDKVSPDVKAAIKVTCSKLLRDFDSVRDWGYWRNCLEVKNRRAELEAVLPSGSAGHKQVREHMMEMIEHCCLMAALPKWLVDEVEREKRPVAGTKQGTSCKLAPATSKGRRRG